MELCLKNKIAITDIAHTIERTKGNCKDSNLKIIDYNITGIEKCLTTRISKILFTSKFVEKHFNKIFPLNNIPSFVLVSPSPSARIYIAGLDDYKNMIKNKEITSTYEYRLVIYKRLLQS
jgi:hypothetical protein